MARTTLSRTKRNPGQRSFKRAEQPNSRNRPAHNPQLVSATVAMATLELTFDRPAFVQGLTGITVNVAAIHEVSAANTSANVILITYSGSIAAATEMTFPPYTGNIRSADGGYAVIPTFPVGA